ncbi:Aminopeptidase 2 mitochondrial [Friedmanniomyces endolithicus]|nr:Aminopeptidase 2 mitochondrial [Friedmanniomyces endolithicus]KAK0775683.1 Aminopeptidase 2 mitochondrial [Friedmanniomyces endolithicus]KAK0808750.1 Aminopeptidase 2 mitochondrial [Friedmanniomyces endolithicus]
MCRQGHEADTSSMDVSHGREVLPKNVKPTHYDLTLEPNLETFKYNGTVTVDLDVKEDTKSISLNTYEIDIQETKITSGENVISSSPKLSYNEDAQATKIDFEQTIPAGSKAKLFLKFTGTLNDSMAGFYRSSYKDASGNEKWMATSQMEPTDARRAFPCFDEPALKAEFTVTLIADHKMTCLSNMDVASEKDVDSQLTESKRKAVTFNKSPLMSTYLLAFIVGELKVHEDRSFRIPVRVYMTPDKDLDHGKFSAELGARTLEFYEKEFDSEFPLPKMDMVAIPDFSAGAMENWGLITYRVVDLLLDEKTASASTRQRVAEVVQHELAHQWFGNLVTMDFWDGLWLNEGFATWMSWYSCNKFYPEWKVWQGYVTDNLQSALGLDSLRSSHPIEVPVKRADEINQIFDAISYSKGSCVIRMISKHLGEDIFMEGIRRYLKNHAYGNTQTGDLWAALSDASGKDVVSVADTWTKYVGFPVITVEEDVKESAIKVKQNRFLRTADVKPEEDKTIYPVFLGLRTKDGIQEDLTLNKREDTFKVPDMDFYKLNADHSGIYRTNYTPERLRKLGENAKAGLLSVEDRAGMLADAGALTAAGYQKTSGLLSLLKGFDTEPDFVVWDEITARIGAVRAAWIFQDDKVKDALKAFSRDLVSSKAHKLGWEFKESDGHIEQQFKALLFGSAASAGDEKTKSAAFDMFDKFVKGDRQAIHPNIRGAVYSVVLQYGGEKEYDAILKEYETAKNADERNTALRSVGRAKDPKLIQRSLAYSLSKEVKDQDIYLPLAGLRAHKEGIEAFWTWMKANWATLKKKLPPSLTMMGSVVAMGTSGFTSEAQRADVEKFFKEVGTKGFERNLAQSLDSIEAKAGWLERDAKDVEEWLKENKYFMPSHLKPPDSDDHCDELSSAEDSGHDSPPRQISRTPRPYHHDGQEVRQDTDNGGHEPHPSRGDVVPEQGRDRLTPAPSSSSLSHDKHTRNGQGSVAASESGTEADDERPSFVRALPPATSRPRKGLKTGEKSEDALLTPSQLDDEERRLERGYFKINKIHGSPAADQEERAEQEKLLRRRLGEFARRTSEVALMGVIIACVLCGRGVLHTAIQWRVELLSYLLLIIALILAYPVKLSIVDTQAQRTKLWQRFRVPASFDPATVLYPPLLPVLVALCIAPANPAVIMPNIVLGLASLPQRLFPRSSRLGGFNVVHWLVSIVPLILSRNIDSLGATEKPGMPGSGPPLGLNAETLVSLYPLHHAFLVPLHYLTTSSLLISELHLLSVALINLLFFASSPQMVILKACLWIGGVPLFFLSWPVLHWNVTLARVPRWKLRRPGHSAEERKSLVDAVSDLINIQRATAAFRGAEHADSDADEDEAITSIKERLNGVPKLLTKFRTASFGSAERFAPLSAIEPRQLANGLHKADGPADGRVRRSTLSGGAPPPIKIQPSIKRKPRSKLAWFLQLTAHQAARRKWLYAGYIYIIMAAVAMGPVRGYVQERALHGQDPFGWAISYLFGHVPLLRSIIEATALQSWVPSPLAPPGWHTVHLTLPLNIDEMRHALGAANVRLLLLAYWISIIASGLLAVFTLTAFVEVDTRRKVFHGVMVAVLLPTVFIDPCYCALGLGLVLAVFLLLEVIRAGLVPPLGSAIGRFVAPYVDGRDLRGPVVVSHIFLLIGCAVPLWFSLACMERAGDRPWVEWEVAGGKRECAMLAGVICVGTGDAAASLIGRRYGRRKWIWVGGKSLEGSAAFVVAVTVGLMAAKAWQVFGGWNDTVEVLSGHLGHEGKVVLLGAWLGSLAKAVFCACGASFMEAVLTGANDNVVVPVALWLLVKGVRL